VNLRSCWSARELDKFPGGIRGYGLTAMQVDYEPLTFKQIIGNNERQYHGRAAD